MLCGAGGFGALVDYTIDRLARLPTGVNADSPKVGVKDVGFFGQVRVAEVEAIGLYSYLNGDTRYSDTRDTRYSRPRLRIRFMDRKVVR